ncbi:MAG: 50S ribosomal protein L21e [Candidatus Aenigmatarchaeota archaeon]
MVSKSHGPRRGTRKRFKNERKATVNQFMRKFELGDKIVIDIESSSSKGMPFRRFQGRTGKVVGQRGRAYLIEIKDGNMVKKIATNPEHIKTI